MYSEPSARRASPAFISSAPEAAESSLAELWRFQKLRSVIFPKFEKHPQAPCPTVCH